MAKTRILLIDDEIALTEILKINLEETGRFEVRVENRGAAAVATACAFKPDVVFLDVIMPDMDGGQVAAELRGDPRLSHVPIVYLTAIVSKQETRRTDGVIGGHAFIAKPVGVAEVIACIERHLTASPAPVDGAQANAGGTP